ncbi:MAG: hypothetical protein KKA62_02710 [Nanoarchaeota archaeon]|nr:hypothetical protein [Nanoarchaeota archaeon]MBU1644549.1 hypothetical protein [Nanoarchaeota archaeon]MBU1976842.1 hypothetical protein [Nanoarchaeota archaeon]
MVKIKYSPKFYLGVILLISNFIIAKIMTVIFFLYFNNKLIRWSSLVVYVLTWGMLILGAYWVGKEYAKAINKYFSYKYYHKSFKEGTKRALNKTKIETIKLHSNVKERTKSALNRTKELRASVKNRLSPEKELPKK